MNRSASLERGYRRLLAAYPATFRRENEDEILAVLLATAEPGRRRPGLAVSADLLRSAALMRLRPTVPRSARTVRAAVKLICLSALAEAAALISLVVTYGSIKAEVLKLAPADWPGTSLHLTVDFVTGPIIVAMLLWLAWAAGRGHDWARLVFSALFGLTTLAVLFALALDTPTVAPAAFTCATVVWFSQLGAVLLIFNPRSARYYGHEPAQRQSA
ncbi:MAG TPA: hypothetical protein VMH35_02685 [Streptosporangiaceae bacterium]|nr:hypothetical protein [Streptosporangiaceae bacterium]